jgi:hypothetical protein
MHPRGSRRKAPYPSVTVEAAAEARGRLSPGAAVRWLQSGEAATSLSPHSDMSARWDVITPQRRRSRRPRGVALRQADERALGPLRSQRAQAQKPFRARTFPRPQARRVRRRRSPSWLGPSPAPQARRVRRRRSPSGLGPSRAPQARRVRRRRSPSGLGSSPAPQARRVRRRRSPSGPGRLRAVAPLGMLRLGFGLRLVGAGPGAPVSARLPSGAEMPKRAGATTKASGKSRGGGGWGGARGAWAALWRTPPLAWAWRSLGRKRLLGGRKPWTPPLSPVCLEGGGGGGLGVCDL